MNDEDQAPTTTAALRAGTRVEVRSGLDGTWQQGFVIDRATDDGYLLRRDIDHTVLPAVPRDRVRKERKRETWWI